jgi:hypothetical protein
VPIHGHLRANGQAFLWGYGHYLIFSSAAARELRGRTICRRSRKGGAWARPP